MDVFKAFELNELEKEHSELNRPYFEFLRRRGMSIGLYRLAGGDEDHQHPHVSDEVYYVLRGKATLRTPDADREVRPGSVISVDHGVEHRFVDIEDDLQLLVVFAPPEDPRD